MCTPHFRAKVIAALVLAATASLRAQSPATTIAVSGQGDQTEVALAWAADGGVFYDIESTTDLNGGAWTNLTADAPVAATNLVGTLALLSTNTTAFYRVRPLDTDGPAITARYPGPNAVGVGRTARFSIQLTDPSGIDSNAFRLAVNGGAPLLWNSPGVTALPDGYTYDPALVATNWGGFGATATVSFACADLKGNATSQEWTFALEVEPVVAGNLLHLPAPAGGLALRAMQPAAGPATLGELTIVEFLSDRIVFSYAGDHGLYVGAILVSHDLARPFYRRILSLEEDPGNGRVTAFTEDVPLTDIVQHGSFSPEVFISAGGELATLGWGDADLGIGIPFAYHHELAAGTITWPNVRLRPAELEVKLDGSLELSCEIRNWQVTALGADFASSLELGVRSGVDIYGEVEFLSRTTTLGSAPLGAVGGFIGPVPVVITLNVAVDLSFDVTAEGVMSFDTGYDAYATADATMDWTPSGGLTHTYGGSVDVVPVPLEVEVQLSAEANLYLKPRLSALAYGLVGASLDYRRGPNLEIAYTLGDEQAEITLSDTWSVNGALTIVGVDDGDLPEVTFLEDKNIVRTWYWPEIPEEPPVFTVQPQGGQHASGAWVLLSASATGSPEPTYQWYQNGVAMPGKTTAALGFTMSSQAVGSYHCVARNRLGAATSQTASVALPAGGTAPAGMALIPAGSFQMGDSLDGLSSALPVHSVYVSAFYMDRTEVTWAKWQEVRTWAAASGYDIGAVGAGKASNHPVHSVNWYDVVKWCNARSQMEGKNPCYNVSGATYKTGSSAPTCNWSASGYRLPTEAEWEKAARGGLSGKRFPWGDTIQHGRANYYSSTSYGYDTSSTRGHHPNYDDAPTPYTSPVGSFSPNGYGLYDMAGNLWEWCWDWYGSSYYASSPGSDPRGPATGSYRVLRGGCWYYYAYYCRAAIRDYYYPGYRLNYFGFRAVLPPGQQ